METHQLKESGRLVFGEEFPGCVVVEFEPSHAQIAQFRQHSNKDLCPRTELARLTNQDSFLSIRPVVANANDQNFMAPKYDGLIEIVIESRDFSFPQDITEVLDVLEWLPTGFLRHWESGLGMQTDYTPILVALASQGVECLVISHFSEASFAKGTLTVPYHEFEMVRSNVYNVRRYHRVQSRHECDVLSHNALLNTVDGSMFPMKNVGYGKESITRALKYAGAVELSGQARKDAFDVVRKNKDGIAKEGVKELLNLKD